MVSEYRATSSQCLAQRSPYCGEASRRSTSRSKAAGDASASKAATSSGVGGRPIRSNVARRISVLLSASGDGVPGQPLLDTVAAALSDETVRPLNDTVEVTASSRVDFAVVADIYVGSGPGSAEVYDARLAALNAAIVKARKLGAGMSRSSIFGALHPPDSGVEKVELQSPPEDVVCGARQFANCTSISLNLKEA